MQSVAICVNDWNQDDREWRLHLNPIYSPGTNLAKRTLSEDAIGRPEDYAGEEAYEEIHLVAGLVEKVVVRQSAKSISVPVV